MWKLLAKTSKTMERIPNHSLGLFTALLLIIGYFHVESATVSADEDQTRLLGETNVDISCEFTIGAGERANILRIQRRRSTDSSFSDIVSFNIPGNFSVYDDELLRGRADLILLSDSGTLRLREYQCNDAASYKCVFTYVLNQSPAEVEDTMILSIQAEPEGKPSFISGNPNGQVFTEYQELNTRCEADVGLPAGNLVWFGYKDGQSPVDLTSKAIQGQPTQISSGSRYCAFRRESTLKLNLTREYNSFVFRCAVNHSTHQAPTPESSCNDTPCFQSQRIEVQYPVRQSDLAISSNPSGSEFIVGSAVTLKCTVDGNPPATFSWYKDDDRNESISQSGQLELTNLGLDDTGLYSCYGSNTVGGSVYNVSRSINLSIVETTTSSTSTTPSTTPQEPGKTDAVRPEPDTGDTSTIIIAVCVVIGVLFIVAISVACVVIRKKKKQSEVEEPPEKPFNKNNLSMYAKPDLVTDEKKQNYNYKKDDALTYADLKFDDKPRSRRPVALADNMTDYADIAMPQV